MTHDELLADIKEQIEIRKELGLGDIAWSWNALHAVVELHRPSEAWGDTNCRFCFDLAWEPSGLEMVGKNFAYPCPTVQAIEKELQ